MRGPLKISNVVEGVYFDLAAIGRARLVPWPSTSDDGWLVLDRNANGVIDNGAELFGSATRLDDGRRVPHGFAALRELDANGDGLVDASDPFFQRLRVWVDITRDGKSATDELLTMADLGIAALSIDFRIAQRRDESGHLYRWRSPVYMTSGSTRYAYDVVLNVSMFPAYLVSMGCTAAPAEK